MNKVYVSNGNFEVAILDKHALVSIYDYDEYSPGNSNYSQKNKSNFFFKSIIFFPAHFGTLRSSP